MKKEIEVQVQETSYGFVKISVDEKATKEEIETAALDAVHDGNTIWNNSEEKVLLENLTY